MRRILLLLAVSAGSLPLSAAISYQQSKILATNPSTGLETLSFATLPAVGDLIVATAQCESSTTCTLTIDDNQSNSYTAAYTGLQPVGTASDFVVYYGIATTSSGTFTVNLHSTGALYTTLIISDYSGVATTSYLDVKNTASGSSTTPTISATTTNANDLLVVILGQNNFTCNAATAGTGYTMRQAQGACTSDAMALEDTTVSSAGSQTGTMNTDNGGWILVMLAFKALAAPSILSIPHSFWVL